MDSPPNDASIMDTALFPFMLDSAVMDAASPFVDQEIDLVRSAVLSVDDVTNLIAVGDARLIYGSLADSFGLSYVCIDPAAGIHGWPRFPVVRRGWSIRRRLVQDFDHATLPPGPSMWIMHFNIYAYLPTVAIPPGDHVLISTWSDSRRSTQVRERYDRSVAALAATRMDTSFRRTRVGAVGKGKVQLTLQRESRRDVVTVAHYRALPLLSADPAAAYRAVTTSEENR